MGHDVPPIKGVYWNTEVELSTVSIKYRFPVVEKYFSLLTFQSHFYEQNKSKIHVIPEFNRHIYTSKIFSAFKNTFGSRFPIGSCMMLPTKLVLFIVSVLIAP